MTDLTNIARHFLLRGVQHWGQTVEQRENVTREYVNAARFVFGSREGTAWLDGVLANLKRGKFETEVDQLTAALQARSRANV